MGGASVATYAVPRRYLGRYLTRLSYLPTYLTIGTSVHIVWGYRLAALEQVHHATTLDHMTVALSDEISDKLLYVT